MAVVFKPDQQLTRNDLNIFVKDSNNIMFDPYQISYKIVDADGNSLFVDENIVPAPESTGWFWADITIPLGTPIGTYKIQWFFKDNEDSSLQMIEQKFGVVIDQAQVIYTPTLGGVVYYPGQTLSEGDLYINIRNHLGNQVDPYSIGYEVYQRISGLEVLISPQNQQPLRLGVGHYYANYLIPSDSLAGDYFIKWTFQETPSSNISNATQEFAVVTGSIIVESPYTDPAKGLIRKLRFLLRDNNPDRNYHFMPPAQEEVIQGFTQKFGYVWEDEELYEYIDFSVEVVNNMPPLEGWSIDSMPSRLSGLVLSQAAATALRALAINWAHEEWAGDVSGVGLNLEKSSKYMALKENFESSFDKQISEYKEFGVRYIRGLRQPRFGVGVTSALGPFSRVGVQSRRNYIGGDRGMF